PLHAPPSFPTRRSSDLSKGSCQNPCTGNSKGCGSTKGMYQNAFALVRTRIQARLSAANQAKVTFVAAYMGATFATDTLLNSWLRSEEHTSELQSRSDLV